MKKSEFTPLSELYPFDKDKVTLRAVIETPKGSRNKYRYDPGCNCVELASALPAGMVFPFDFGFVPSTLAEDGDPLDVLLLMDAPTPPCCLVQCRLIGVMEARQKARGEKWERNDRLIAVAVGAHTHEHVKRVSDLPSGFVGDLTAFFTEYNKLHDKKFECLGVFGPNKARRLMRDAMAAYAKDR